MTMDTKLLHIHCSCRCGLVFKGGLLSLKDWARAANSQRIFCMDVSLAAWLLLLSVKLV